MRIFYKSSKVKTKTNYLGKQVYNKLEQSKQKKSLGVTESIPLTIKEMLQNSYISDKKISKSMTKLNRVSSDNRFRVKSLRVKTQQRLPIVQSPMKKSLQFPSLTKLTKNQSSLLTTSKNHPTSLQSQLSTALINTKLRVKSCLLQKDYQHQLASRLFFPKHIIQQLYKLKIQSQNIKPSQQKYLQFCKMLYLRLSDRVEIGVEGFNMRGKVLERFLEFYLQWKEKSIIGVDLSMCSQLAYQVKTKQQQEEQLINSSNPNSQLLLQQPLWPKHNLLPRLILNDPRLTKLSLRNMHINPQQMVDLLTKCLQTKHIYSLDIGNKTSQSINRLGTQYYYLQAFFAKNEYLGVMRMDNLNVTDECVQRMCVGMVKNVGNPLKILSIGGNLLTEKSLNAVYNIMTRGGLTQLNLSSNPLTREFYLNLNNLRANTIKHLDLSSTNMDSQSLIHLLQQLSQNKLLQTLKLDSNDFSHHWFNKIKQVFQNGLSIHSLSMTNCGIKNFDYLFEGITHSKYLRRLNVNHNLVDVQNQNVQKMANCFRNNKVLQDVRMRFSGYNQQMLCQILQPLKNNQYIQVIDISQNHMSDNGGKLIIKMLGQNKSIKQMGIDKLQFTVKMTQDIHKLINFNKQKRQKQQFHLLVDANKVYKAKDTMSWNDIEKLSEQAKKLQKAVGQSRSRNEKIQMKITQKKQHFMELRKQCKNEEKKLDKEIKAEEIKFNNILKKAQLQIDLVVSKQQQTLSTLQIQHNLILTLQNKIAKQNQKIQKRQHQLQQQLRDEKYLQKRKEQLIKQQLKLKESMKSDNEKLVKPKNSSGMFDNTKGLTSLSKRKGSENNNNNSSSNKKP